MKKKISMKEKKEQPILFAMEKVEVFVTAEQYSWL